MMPLTAFRTLFARLSSLSIHWLFVIALLPCMVAGLALLAAYLGEKRSDLEAGAQQTARAVAEAVDNHLAGIISNLQILATSPHLEAGDLDAFHKQVTQVAGANELVNVIALIRPSGDIALINLLPFGSRLPKTSHPEELQKALATWRPVVSDYYLGAVSQKPYISVQVPVRVKGKPFSLIMAVPTVRLAHILENVKLPSGHVAAIADSKGRVVARSYRHDETVGKMSPPSFMEEMKKGRREGVFTGRNIDGVSTFAAYQRSAISGWFIVIGVPQGVLYRTVDGRLMAAGIVTLSSIVLALLLAFGFSHRLESALKKFAAATRDAAAGANDVAVPTDAPQEVTEVVQRFNEMQAARRKAQREQVRIKRALVMLNELNSALLQANEEQALLPEVCRLIVQQGGYLIAWIGFAQSDREKSVKPVAIYGSERASVQRLRITWGDDELGQGPTGTAIRTGRPQVRQDMLSDPAMGPWRSAAVEHGCMSSVSLPLKVEGSVIGALTIYASETHAFGDEEVSLLEKLAGNMAFGIERLRTRQLLSNTNQELQGFTYAASHDMKAPLQRIATFSDLLSRNHRQELSGDAGTLVDFIKDNADRVRLLVEDLLEHAQIEQVALVTGPITLGAAVRATIEENRGEIAEAGAEISVDVPDVTVLANPLALSQVLRNLLANALKYAARSAPPRIEIGGRSDGESGCLWVRDNGIGFDMAYHDRIFEIFRRLHTYAEFPGSGVGLALVKKAMNRMGGRVWAESTPGVGATFYIELPLASRDTCDAAAAAAKAG